MHRVRVLLPYVYYIMLALVIVALFFTNYTANTVVSADKTAFAFLQNSALLTPFPALTFLIPLFSLFVGGLGMMILIEHIQLHEKKRLMAFIGAVGYILNPFTLAIIREPYTPSLWFIALLPWLLWTFFIVLCDSDQPPGRKLFLFSMANIAIAPALGDHVFFGVYFLFLLVVSLGLVFSKYFFRAVWRSPWLILLMILLQLPWLGPFLLEMYEAPSMASFAPLRTAVLPNLYDVNLFPFLIIGFFGIFLLQRYYFIFLFLLAVIASLWSPLPQFVLQFLKPYSYYFFIPAAFVSGYFIAAGVSMVSIIATLYVQLVHKHRTKHHSMFHQVHGKTPYDIYKEIQHLTHTAHGAKNFTPLMFTEHFLQHILSQAHQHLSKTTKQKTLVPRVVGYVSFVIIVLSCMSVFRGGLFGPDYLVTVSPQLSEVMGTLRSIKTNRIAFLPATDPSSMELKTGIERENEKIVQTVIEKYVLSHVLIDSTHLLPTQLQFLSRQPNLSLQKQADNVFLFSVKNPVDHNNRFVLGENIPNVGPRSTGIGDDMAYRNHGLYITDEGQEYTAYYPFMGLADKRFNIGEKTTTLETQLGDDIMKALDRYELESGTESADITMVGDAGQVITIPATMYPELIGNRLVLTMNNQRVRYFSPKKNIDDTVYLETQALEQRYGYLLQVLNKKELSRQFKVEVYDRSRTYKYEDASVISDVPLVLKPSYDRGIGYVFGITPERFDNLTIYYLPYLDTVSTRFVKTSELTKRASLKDAPKYSSLANGLYEIKLKENPKPKQTLIFLEPYSSGWKLYQKDPQKVHNALEGLLARWLPFLYGKEYGTHVSVNNWANGWSLDAPVLENSLTVVDVPRYISYASWIVVGILVSIFGLFWFMSWYRRLD